MAVTKPKPAARKERPTGAKKRPTRAKKRPTGAKKRPTGASKASPHVRKPAPNDVLAELRTFGLGYPGAHTKSPWPDHLDLAVNDKTFAYLSVDGEPFGISCKLPESGMAALELPFATPTAYGLGKSGWVTAKFAPGEALPVALLKEWIDESYRAQAPKKLVASLGSGR